jgi:EmrB/QacA subfamily drug resistance transporter
VSDVGRNKKTAVLAVTCLGQFMVLLDNTIVTTALPQMQRHLHTSLTGLQWIVDSYVLAVAVLLLTGGVIGDRYGRKRTFLAGLVVFTTASLLCGLASGSGWLIAARVLQGVGAAGLSPGSLALIASTFTVPRERARAIGLWAGISGIGLSVGPVAGGLLVDYVGWQAVFLVNVPIGVVTFLYGMWVLNESRNPHRRAPDIRGLLLSLFGMGALTYGLITAGRDGWTSAPVLGCFAAAVVLLVAFLVAEARVTAPMLPLRLFGERLFSVSNFAMVALGFGLLGSAFFFSQFFQIVQGYSAFRAGLQSLASTAAMFMISPFAGRLAGRFGFRRPVAFGMLCASSGLLALSFVHSDTPYVNVWWRLSLIGIGFGLAMSPLTAAAISTVAPQEGGLASGVSNTSRQIGSVLGVAVLGTIVRVEQSHGASFTTALNAAFLTSGLITLGVAAIAAIGLTRSRAAAPPHGAAAAPPQPAVPADRS